MQKTRGKVTEKVTTAIGTSNIAFVKYWGRREERINLPMNSSISMTLDDTMSTKTSVIFSNDMDCDRLFIDGKEEDLRGEPSEKSKFTMDMLNYLRIISNQDAHVLIVSENGFPSSSGLASSASGGATLAFALSHALNLGLSQREISIIARRISGSACRSVYGGIVKWNKGSKADGSDSYAEQVVNENYWSDLTDIIAIADPSKKKVSSSTGHSSTIRTSSLYASRPAFAEEGTGIVASAVLSKDFQKLAEAIMRDSNNMHATMLDTWPPIIYLTDTSRDIMYAIHELNLRSGQYVAAYTFDAGANAHIITTARHANEILDLLKDVPGVTDTIKSKSGSGPRILGDDASLIDADALIPLKRR